MYLQACKTPLGENPYWVFVSFLYAWIAADIAERFAEISSIKAGTGEKAPPQRVHWQRPIWSHLVLAGFIVGTSWIGWTKAVCRGDVPTSEGVIEYTSLLLIVDFAILATYFSFTRVIYEARLSDKLKARPEQAALWLSSILILYVAWDFVVYWVIPWNTGGQAFCAYASQFWASSWMSVLCAGVAISAFFLFKYRVPADCPLNLLATDVSLLALVLSYRTLKQLAAGPDRPCWLYGFKWGCLICFVVAVVLAVICKKPPDPQQEAKPAR
jgi:hypothetical protein